MRAFACPITKEFFEYPNNCEFYVYSRKSNSPKRLIYVGKNVNKAWELYQSIKLFKMDFKYLYFCDIAAYSGEQQLIKKKSGTDARPLHARSLAKRSSVNYLGKSVGPFRDVPKTLATEMRIFCRANSLGESKLYQILIAELFSYDLTKVREIIKSYESKLHDRKLQDATTQEQERIEILGEIEAKKEEDDLL
jgi:hypothetical protein